MNKHYEQEFVKCMGNNDLLYLDVKNMQIDWEWEVCFKPFYSDIDRILMELSI